MESTRIKVQKKIIKQRTANELLKNEITALKNAEDNLYAYQEAQTITQDVVKQVQEQAHSQISKVVTICLEAIFEEPYYFQIHFEQKRGRTEAKLTFERNGHEINPMTASGGGVIEIASFALRLACILLSRPKLRPVMILDEPFKNVSKKAGYLERVPEMLISLSEEFGIQFIMVTHIEELKIGTIIKLD